MAKNQHTFAKRQREMEKRRKAEEKRIRRQNRNKDTSAERDADSSHADESAGARETNQQDQGGAAPGTPERPLSVNRDR